MVNRSIDFPFGRKTECQKYCLQNGRVPPFIMPFQKLDSSMQTFRRGSSILSAHDSIFSIPKCMEFYFHQMKAHLYPVVLAKAPSHNVHKWSHVVNYSHFLQPLDDFPFGMFKKYTSKIRSKEMVAASVTDSTRGSKWPWIRVRDAPNS